MTTKPELDRAIVVADNAYCNHIGLPEHEFAVDEADRIYARALVAELLRGMEPTRDMTPAARGGFMRAVREFERRAGLESEG